MDRNTDMFNNLADTIIILIISFLPFRDAVRTAILSKRWRDLWDIEQWTKIVIGRKVKELDLDFSGSKWNGDRPYKHNALVDLPSCVYGHATLQSLKLQACNFQVSMFRNFSALKKLSVGWVRLTSSSLDALITNCPRIESLSLKKCRDLSYLHISEMTLRLRDLEIYDCSPLENGIMLSTPNLRSFKYFGTVNVFDLDILRSLEEVDLDFGLEDEFRCCGDYLCDALHGLGCARVLTVCSYMTQVLPSGEEPLSLPTPLYELKHLRLKTWLHSNELPGIAFLFKSCPILETLTIEMGFGKIFQDYDAPYNYESKAFWRTRIFGFACLKEKLKVVEIKGFKGRQNEVLLLQYLLKEGRALELMTIYTSKEVGLNVQNADIFLKNAQRLLRVERASRNAIVLIR